MKESARVLTLHVSQLGGLRTLFVGSLVPAGGIASVEEGSEPTRIRTVDETMRSGRERFDEVQRDRRAICYFIKGLAERFDDASKELKVKKMSEQILTCNHQQLTDQHRRDV